jgi:hypothetical protein
MMPRLRRQTGVGIWPPIVRRRLMRVRPLAFYGVIASLLCVYCNRSIGGGFDGQGMLNDGTSCTQDSDCASFNCVGSTCGAPASGKAEIDAPCNGDGDCIPEASCQSGFCIQTSAGPSGGGNGGSISGTGGSIGGGTGGSSPACVMAGGDCSGGVMCCAGLHCDDTSMCMGCTATGNPCNGDSDCCSQSCDTAGSGTCN